MSFIRVVMKKSLSVLLTLICFISNISLAQLPDTIRIKTDRIKGYGPFERSTSFIQPLTEDNPWNKAIPNYKGLPDTLEYFMFATEQTDFLQYTYQSYYNNTLNHEVFESCKSSWNWNPSPNEYTKDLVKVNIGVVAGYDSNGELKSKLTKTIIMIFQMKNILLYLKNYLVKIGGEDILIKYLLKLNMNIMMGVQLKLLKHGFI
jgi:hypothetical protein